MNSAACVRLSPAAFVAQVILLALSITLFGCVPTVHVTVFQPSPTILLGNTQQYAVALTETSNPLVTWSVNGVPGGNSTEGTISPNGLYTAPQVLPSPATVSITATSKADSKASTTVSLTVMSDISVAVMTSPGNQQALPYGAMVQLTAKVSSQGHPNLGVNWLVEGTNTNLDVGSITVTGQDTATYTAPASYANANPIQIIAQSVADSSQSAGVPFTIFADAVLAGAGDIADCGNLNLAGATAGLLSGISGTVFAVGDLAYPNGSDGDFASCYDPTWGGLKSRTRPAPGNHEYQTPNAQGYFNYWGAAAGDPRKGYYSYDLGAWHVVVVNSACEVLPAGTVTCSPFSAQRCI